MKLFILPMLASLAALFALTDKTAGKFPVNLTDISFNHTPAAIVNDTPRIKYFARVEAKKITGDLKSVVIDDVNIYIINGTKQFADELRLRYSGKSTITADEMIVTSANDKNAIRLYGSWGVQGVIEFKNAKIIPPMINAKDKPLFLFNDQEQKDLQSINSLNPNEVTRIMVLTDHYNTVGMYGDKAKYGVVEIYTRAYTAKESNIEGVRDEVMVPEKIAVGVGIVQEKQEIDPNKVYEKVEIEPSFKGGEAAWRKYLERNLDKTAPQKNGAPAGTYTAWIQFIVDIDGNVSDVKALSSHGFGIEEEAIKVIRGSSTNKWEPATQNGAGSGSSKARGMWVPAIQNGRQVRAYRKQPITFVVE